MQRKPLIYGTLLIAVGVGMLLLLWKELDKQPLPRMTKLEPTKHVAHVDDSDVGRPRDDPHQRNPNLPPSLLDNLNNPTTTPENDVRLLATVFADYASVFKRVPLGMHQEIVDSLQGKNPRAIRYIPEGHPAVSASSEIVDRWGKPFFFHVISKDAMEIISAGPDGLLFTEDDVRNAPPQASVEPDLAMLLEPQ